MHPLTSKKNIHLMSHKQNKNVNKKREIKYSKYCKIKGQQTKQAIRIRSNLR